MARRPLTATDIVWVEEFSAGVEEEAGVLAKLASALMEAAEEGKRMRSRHSEEQEGEKEQEVGKEQQDDLPIE